MALLFLSANSELRAPVVAPTTVPLRSPDSHAPKSQYATWNRLHLAAVGCPIAAAGLLGAAAAKGRRSVSQPWLHRPARGARGRVIRQAAGDDAWHAASTAADGSVADLLKGLPTGGDASGGYALLFVPRQRAAEIPTMVADVEAAVKVPVLATTTAGNELQLGMTLGGNAHAFSLGVKSIKEDIAGLAGAASQAKSLLLFARPGTPPGYTPFAFKKLRETFPSAAVAGAVVAPAADKASPICCSGTTGECGIIGVAVDATANVGMDECGFEPFGEEMEIFECVVQRTGPAIIRTIGTEAEGTFYDMPENNKGLGGKPRRAGIPAAEAIQDAMTAASVAAPKDVMIGVPGLGSNAPTAVAGADKETWTLFPWARVTPEGGVVLGGNGPKAAGVAPKFNLERAQCFRAGAPAEGGSTSAVAAAVSPGSAVLAISAGASPNALKALSEKAGPGTLALEGSIVFASPAGGGPAVGQTKAVGIVALAA